MIKSGERQWGEAVEGGREGATEGERQIECMALTA